MGLRMKNFNIMGVYWKIQFLGWVTKNQYIAGNCLERMGLPKKRGGGWLIPKCTLWSHSERATKKYSKKKSNQIFKLSSLIHENKLKQNLFHLLLSVLPYTVYLYCIRKLSRCFFLLSFFSHVTILIKHKLKDLFWKNHSVIFDAHKII